LKVLNNAFCGCGRDKAQVGGARCRPLSGRLKRMGSRVEVYLLWAVTDAKGGSFFTVGCCEADNFAAQNGCIKLTGSFNVRDC